LTSPSATSLSWQVMLQQARRIFGRSAGEVGKVAEDRMHR